MRFLNLFLPRPTKPLQAKQLQESEIRGGDKCRTYMPLFKDEKYADISTVDKDFPTKHNEATLSDVGMA